MLGVQRSKGCRLCLERRVKCDRSRPGCLQCLRQSRPCPGYPEDVKFRDEGPKLRRRFQLPKLLYEESGAATAVLSSFAQVEVRDGPKELMLHQRMAPSLFSPVAHQQQLLHTFIWSMTASHQNELSPALGTYRRWLPHLLPLAGTHTLLDQSVRACTLAHVGRLHRSDIFMHEAEVHYGRALFHLNDGLQDPSKGFTSETLGSTILLSVFEMFASDSNQSWMQHADGVTTLMQLRGPRRHRDGVDREMFLAYRRTLVSQALQMGRKTFLKEPEWRQLSHDIHQDIRKSGVFSDILKSEIFEVDQLSFLETATLCDLAHDLKRARQKDRVAEQDVVLSNVLMSLRSCRRTTKSLLRRLRTAIKGAGHEPVRHATNDLMFPMQYEYINMYVASLHVGLWTSIIGSNMLLTTFEQSQQKVQQYNSESDQLARECCQSVAYMTTSSFLGPFFMIIALRRCVIVLKRFEEKAWVYQKLTELGDSSLAMARDVPVHIDVSDVRASH